MSKFRKMFLGILCLVIMLVCGSVAANADPVKYNLDISAGCDNNADGANGGIAYTDSNKTTPLPKGSLVQFIYAGKDGVPNDATSKGGVTGDDVLLTFGNGQMTATVGSDTVHGKFTDVDGQFYHTAGSVSPVDADDLVAPKVFIRVWNGTSFELATKYWDSPLVTPAFSEDSRKTPAQRGVVSFGFGDSGTEDKPVPDSTVVPTELWFTAEADGTLPATQEITINNIGTGGIAWTATMDPAKTWLAIAPSSGSIEQGKDAKVAVSITSISGLTVDNWYSTNVKITPDDEEKTVKVNLHFIQAKAKISKIEPDKGKIGSTIVITGSSFGTFDRTKSVIMVGAVAVKPTDWKTDRIIASIPSGVSAGTNNITVTSSIINQPSDVYSFNVETDGIVIDDFQGGAVGTWNLDYDGNGKPESGSYVYEKAGDPNDPSAPLKSTSYPEYFNVDTIQKGAASIFYSYGPTLSDGSSRASYVALSDWGGGWAGKLANQLDLNSVNRFSFDVVWDGSENEMALSFKDADGTSFKLKKNITAAKLKANGTITVNREDFIHDETGSDVTSNADMEWSKVASYGFTYNTKNTSAAGNNQSIDNLRASLVPITISDVSITREGADIAITWKTSPAGSPVDIYSAKDAFTTDVSKWTKQFGGVTGTKQIEQGQVGKGATNKAKYYKVVQATLPLTTDLISQYPVVGKFNLDAVEGSNLVSLPLIPTSANIDAVVGDQIAAGTSRDLADVVYFYDSATMTWHDAWRYADTSTNTITWSGDMTTMDPDKGYFITRRFGQGATEVTVVGKIVLTSPRTIALNQFSNMIGSAYPTEVALNSSGLSSPGVLTASSLPVSADKVYYYDAKAQKWQTAYLDVDGFKSLDLTSLQPGKGYYVNKQVSGSVDWTYTK